MNIDIDQYRSRIGTFIHKCSKFLKTKKSKILNFNSGKVISYLVLSLIILNLILTAGDVEKNPGPSDTHSSSGSSVPDAVSTDILHREKNIKILHMNVHSLRNKIDALKIEVVGFDIIGLTETWLDNSVSSDDLLIHGFHLPLRNDRPENPHGGVALYIRDIFGIKPRGDLDVPGLEAIWAEVINQNQKYLIGTIYRAPNKSVEYWNLIEESIEKAKDTGINQIFLMGDFNDNQLAPISKLRNLLSDYHIEQLINEPTHFTDHSATCLDIIATTCPDNVIGSGTVCPSLSNHNGVYATINTQIIRKNSHKRTIWDYKHANWDELIRTLKEKDWSNVYQ